MASALINLKRSAAMGGTALIFNPQKNRSAAFGRFVFGINTSSRAQLESSRRQSAAKF
jgi:hypothetical protein